MLLKSNRSLRQTQVGSSLIEVLIAILILSFGMLALGGMLSYAVMLPKLAGYRASAASIANAHVERMRANLPGFTTGQYASTTGEPHTFNVQTPTVVANFSTPCAYPSCNPTSIAQYDINQIYNALRRELPGFAGIRVICSGACNSMARPEGDMWVMWAEPTTFSSINDTGNSDECPDPTVAPTFTPFTSPKPRCIRVRFKL